MVSMWLSDLFITTRLHALLQRLKAGQFFSKPFSCLIANFILICFNSQQKLMNIDSFFKVEARTGSLFKCDGSSENRPL